MENLQFYIIDAGKNSPDFHGVSNWFRIRSNGAVAILTVSTSNNLGFAWVDDVVTWVDDVVLSEMQPLESVNLNLIIK